MMGILQRGFWRPAQEPEIDPEVALIMQELDEELSREHELLDDGLDRTSRDVGSLLRGFAQRCQKIALVGSHRRGKPEPGDIDVLYIPKSNLQVIEFLEEAADDEKDIRHNGAVWRCNINGRQVDFIESTEKAWGMDMVQFTGSRDFLQRFLRHAVRRGIAVVNEKPVYRRQDSYNEWTVPAFDGWPEEKILEHLGLAEFLDPRRREPVLALVEAVPA